MGEMHETYKPYIAETAIGVTLGLAYTVLLYTPYVWMNSS